MKPTSLALSVTCVLLPPPFASATPGHFDTAPMIGATLSLQESIANGTLGAEQAITKSERALRRGHLRPPRGARGPGRMPIIEPDRNVDFRMLVKRPDEKVDYKILMPEESAETPLARR